MRHQKAFRQLAIAISTSESPDMPRLGLSHEHLRDATGEIARHLLALGARLVYGGDLRSHGFTDLLFELVARHQQETRAPDDRPLVANYLAWPVHIQLSEADLELFATDLLGAAELVCLTADGRPVTTVQRAGLASHQPTDHEWVTGLTAMRRFMVSVSNARIVLGGRTDQFRGVMPGIAEESLLSLQTRQPLFVLGGFGGCARDVAEAIGITAVDSDRRGDWPCRGELESHRGTELRNGLSPEENSTLARTPHIDQAITLILRGLWNLVRQTKPDS